MQAQHQTRYFDVEQGAPEHNEILRNESRAKFAIDQESLSGILDANDIEFLNQYGGVEAIASALESNLEMGIKGDEQDLHLRHEVFGSNLFLEDGDELAPTKTYLKLALESAKESTTILLLCYATLSIVLGELKYGVESGWCDGAMMFFVVFLSFFVKLYKERTRQSMLPTTVDVMRDGNLQNISASQVTVGDVVILKIGDRVPANGLFISASSSFRLDDVEYDDEDPVGVDYNRFPVIQAGTEVVVGNCRMLVISVGKNTRWRSKMMNHHKSPWLVKLDKLSLNMEKILLGLSVVLLVVQLLCYFLIKNSGNGGKQYQGESKSTVNTSMEELIHEAAIIIKKNSGNFARLVAVLGVVLMLGVREGLNLGIFITFSYSKRKLKIDHQAIVENLPACAGLGLVTTFNTCETVDLALNKTSMADLWIGGKIVKEATTELTHELLHALREGVGLLNSSGPFKDGLLCWAKLFLGVNMEELVQSCTILPNEEEEAFIDGNCCSLSLTRNGVIGKNIIHMYWRGPPEIVLPMCSHFYSVDGQRISIDENQRIDFEQIASDCLDCTAFAYKQVVMEEEGGGGKGEDDGVDDDDEPPKLIKQEEEEDLVDDGEEEEKEEPPKQEEKDLTGEEEVPKLTNQNMTLLGFVGLKNPYPEELKQAVEACRDAGVKITLIVNHDKNTATFMGINSGVLSPTDDISKVVVEASQLQNIPENDDDVTQIRRRVDDIRVLANSSPPDMLLLLQYQKQQTGKVVAVVGGNKRDFPALNEADVGFWIGDGGVKEAKESSSDIIMSSKSLVSISAVIRRGRFVYVNVQKFIQLHLSVNIVGVAVNFIAGIPSGDTPLSAVQVLWVGLVTDTLGAFALSAADPPPGKAFPLAAPWMAVWRNVLIQVLYQTSILLMLHFKGKIILHVDDQATMDVIVFNAYVMCQVFGLLNASQIDWGSRWRGKLFSWKNFSEKIYRNRWFVAASGATVVLHLAAVEIATVLISHKMILDSRKWLFSTGVAALSLLIGYVAKCIPVFDRVWNYLKFKI